jgi:hypothetical protein
VFGEAREDKDSRRPTDGLVIERPERLDRRGGTSGGGEGGSIKL